MKTEEQKLKQRESDKLWRMNNPEYAKQYYEANKERIKARSAKYNEDNKDAVRERERQRYQSNREHYSARARKYNEDNKDAIKEYNAEYSRLWRENNREYGKIWRENNPQYGIEASRLRNTRLERAIPGWYEDELVKRLYLKRKELNQRYGANLHVDHIIPIQSDTVCGLHCWANLQLLDKSLNQSKSNSYQQDWS